MPYNINELLMSTSLKQKVDKEPAGINKKLNPATRVSSEGVTEGMARLEARITPVPGGDDPMTISSGVLVGGEPGISKGIE